MLESWIARLEQFAPLSGEDKLELGRLLSEPRRVHAGEDIVREGEAPTHIHIIVSGIACCYKVLPDGGRQIIALHFPSHACDIHHGILSRVDHAIGALRPTQVAYIPHENMLDLLERSPRIAKALWRSTLNDNAILREWLVNIGRREGYGRVAHILYEVYLRLKAVGQADNHSFEFPLTQTELADALGLTPVHVSRVISRLRAESLIVLRRRAVTIIDPEGLKAVAQFSPGYLQMADQGPEGNKSNTLRG
ncbi:MAG: transcriptional regulator, Crp/Fnr family [Rhodospirillales bacterium]|jgi:CRP-like cAMP-binding protein|nr:transcriptional regulator, Crp/Fnr family [Rhodospirillales bacterium]